MRRMKPNWELLARHLQPEEWWMASPAAGERTHLRLGCLLGSLAGVLSPSTVALQHAWRGTGADSSCMLEQCWPRPIHLTSPE